MKKSKSSPKQSKKPNSSETVDATKKKDTPQKAYYVDPAEFTAELKKYYETDVITDNLALMIKNIAYGLAHASNFINYTFKEDAIGDCLINMFNALKQKKYDFSRGHNPFSYFNSISFNCWRSRIKKEKRSRDTLAAYQEEVYSIIGHDMGTNNQVNTNKRNENS